MTKAQLTALWVALGVAALFTVFQPVCHDSWWLDSDFFRMAPKWSVSPIFTGLEDGTVPFLVRIGIVATVIIGALVPRLRLCGGQRKALYTGLSVCFVASLLQFDNQQMYIVFDSSYELEANMIVFMVICTLVTAAAIFSLRDRGITE